MFLNRKFNKQEITKMVKFAITGVGNTLVDYLIFALLTKLCGVNPYEAQIYSYGAGMLNSYLLNRNWTFQSKERFFSLQMLRFIITNLIVLGASIWILKALIESAGMDVLVAKFVTICVTMVLNFVISRLWVFKT